MATKIITKTGSGAPTTSDVDRGELAVDLTNKQLYTNDGSSIIKLGSGAGEGQWSLAPNGDDIYYNDGNVGIGTDDPTKKLDVNGDVKFGSGNSFVTSTNIFRSDAPAGIDGAYLRSAISGAPTPTYANSDDTDTGMFFPASNELGFSTGGTDRMRIDADGRVGIGITPVTFDLSAKEQLAEWKTKAKKASWPIVTDGAFEQEPTIEMVQEFVERVAHSGKLQVEGGASINGDLLASKPNAGANAFSAGNNAGATNQGQNAVAVGHDAGETTQGDNSVAVGNSSGKTSQAANAVAVGGGAGKTTQGSSSVGVGYLAGETTQGNNAVAVGVAAGRANQGFAAVGVGSSAGKTNQGDNAVAVGRDAGETDQGDNSIAIGRLAGQTNQAANGIIISSRGVAVNDSANPNHILLASDADKYLYYNGTDAWTFAGGDVTVPNDNLLVGTTSTSTTSDLGVKINAGLDISGSPVASVGSSASNGVACFSSYSTAAAAYRFYTTMAGNIYATSSSITAISDISLKDNVRDLDKGLNTVLSLKPRRFDWKNGDGNDIMGFIAQEVDEVLPEIVHDYKYSEGETKLGIRMGDMIPSLVKAIQEQQAMIETLQAEVATLKGA